VAGLDWFIFLLIYGAVGVVDGTWYLVTFKVSIEAKVKRKPQGMQPSSILTRGRLNNFEGPQVNQKL